MKEYLTFEEFWPFYVGEHSKPPTRLLHFIGTSCLFPILYFAITINYWFGLALPVIGYGFAWFAHFKVEHNRPATFTYPLWSLIADFKMWAMMLTGRMDAEVERCKTIMDLRISPHAT